MSEVIYLNTRRFIDTVQSEMSPTSGPRIFVREARAGLWLVHDEDDQKGGCFRNRRAAFQFVEDEFGSQAEIVVQPKFPTQSRQRSVSHIKQTASVAHRVARLFRTALPACVYRPSVSIPPRRAGSLKHHVQKNAIRPPDHLGRPQRAVISGSKSWD